MKRKINEDSWALVELFRWQYGRLPEPNETKVLEISAGLNAMAKAIEDGCKSRNPKHMPTPSNVCSVLKFCGRKIKELKE